MKHASCLAPVPPFLIRVISYLGVQRRGLEIRWNLCQHGHIHFHFLAFTVPRPTQLALAGPGSGPFSIDVTVAVTG